MLKVRSLLIAMTILLSAGVLAMPGLCNDQAVSLEPAKANGTAKESGPAAVDNQILVVMLYDDSCHKFCDAVRPIMYELATKYGTKMKFVELNTSQKVLKETAKSARDMGVSSFLSSATDWVPIVGIFNHRHKLIKELPGAKNKDVYNSWIDKACKDAGK